MDRLWKTRVAQRNVSVGGLGAAPGGLEVSPCASSARAIDLAGLPPAFVVCGAIDLLIEEIWNTRPLVRAGVPTELHVYPGAPHGFNLAVGAAVTKAF